MQKSIITGRETLTGLLNLTMEWNVDQLTALVIKYVTNQADPQERAMAEEFLANPVNRARIADLLSRDEFLREKAFWDEASDREAGSLSTNLARIAEHESKIRTIATRKWWWVAASLMLLGISVFMVKYHIARPSAAVPAVARSIDLPPGGQRAVLVLSSGKEVVLDSTQRGEIAGEAGVRIEKKMGGAIDYANNAATSKGGAQQAVAYNVLETPRGGAYKVILPDQSVVYLNSESSLKYPTVFLPMLPRVVELTGEAYFAVRHDPASPFRVLVAGTSIEALGTSFDVNAYGDEPDIMATLLEGSVRVTDHSNSVLLRPGQQAQIGGAVISVVSRVDTDAIVGWMNGDFVFNATPLGEVLRQLSRWYNVTVIYDSTKADADGGFTAEISRNAPASEVLKVLAASGYHFTIVGSDRIEADPVKKK